MILKIESATYSQTADCYCPKGLENICGITYRIG